MALREFIILQWLSSLSCDVLYEITFVTNQLEQRLMNVTNKVLISQNIHSCFQWKLDITTDLHNRNKYGNMIFSAEFNCLVLNFFIRFSKNS